MPDGSIGHADVNTEGRLTRDVAVADGRSEPASSNSRGPSTWANEAALMVEAMEDNRRKATRALQEVLGMRNDRGIEGHIRHALQ